MAGMVGYSDSDTKSAVQKRLRRVEGQVRGIQRMVDEDTYCIDVLTQISAATSALQAVALQLLDEHLTHCVAEALAGGGADADAKVAEADAQLGAAEKIFTDITTALADLTAQRSRFVNAAQEQAEDREQFDDDSLDDAFAPDELELAPHHRELEEASF